MATLTQYLKLQDGVSGPLSKMAKAADNLMNKQEAAATAIERTENAANGLARKSSRARSVLNAMANGVTGIADAAYRAENALNGMMGKLRKAPESSGGGFLSSTIGQICTAVCRRGLK